MQSHSHPRTGLANTTLFGEYMYIRYAIQWHGKVGSGLSNWSVSTPKEMGVASVYNVARTQCKGPFLVPVEDGRQCFSAQKFMVC